jgi:hypothetical protein
MRSLNSSCAAVVVMTKEKKEAGPDDGMPG